MALCFSSAQPAQGQGWSQETSREFDNGKTVDAATPDANSLDETILKSESGPAAESSSLLNLDTAFPAEEAAQNPPHEKHPVDSELVVEGEGSFGHYHIFAYTWWSELYTGGIELDRHTWGYFLKSQMDWTMEVLPVTILVQPSKTDVFGDPLSQARFANPGLGVYPIGLRMKWRYDKALQPYFIVKGGMLVFDHKALSFASTYQNFSLQIGLGVQRRLTDRIDLRVGYEDIHFSNAFMVPNNPGLDVMAYDGGIVYRFKK